MTCDVQLHITPTDLSPLSVVLPLAGEGGVLEPAEDLLRSLGGVGQHWLEGDARGEPTVGRELRDSAEEERRDESLVVWVLAGGRVEAEKRQNVNGENCACAVEPQIRDLPDRDNHSTRDKIIGPIVSL